MASELKLVDCTRTPRKPETFFDPYYLDMLNHVKSLFWATFIRPKPLSISTQEMELIRSQAAATLLQAAQDGTLQKVLSKQDEDQARWCRQKLSRKVFQVFPSANAFWPLNRKMVVNFGRFRGFPGFLQSSQDVDTLRREAAKTLLQAAEDGSLEAVLKKSDKERI